MLHLLLSTFGMMVLTFVIGFFVAGVIKIMAIWADSLKLYGSHQKEFIRLKKIQKIHQKSNELLSRKVSEKYYLFHGDKRDRFNRGINDDPTNVEEDGYYHGTSLGVPSMDLLDYYYPKDAKNSKATKEIKSTKETKDSKEIKASVQKASVQKTPTQKAPTPKASASKAPAQKVSSSHVPSSNEALQKAKATKPSTPSLPASASKATPVSKPIPPKKDPINPQK
ncbi:MAG: hypothetical protein RR333_07745 [Bacteroidales bacterium]